jgi:hypothetical protein
MHMLQKALITGTTGQFDASSAESSKNTDA